MTMTTSIPTPVPSGPQADTSLELWRNATAGRVLIKRFGPDGRSRSELIAANKAFHLTPAERRHNQELAARPELDVFTNGTLQPVRLLESEFDTASLLDNPNHIPDDDARKVFKLADPQFKARVEAITNEPGLHRLRDLALERQTRATVWQLRIIEAAIANVAPVIDHVRPEVAGAGSDKPAGDRTKPKAVSPR